MGIVLTFRGISDPSSVPPLSYDKTYWLIMILVCVVVMSCKQACNLVQNIFIVHFSNITLVMLFQKSTGIYPTE